MSDWGKRVAMWSARGQEALSLKA